MDSFNLMPLVGKVYLGIGPEKLIFDTSSNIFWNLLMDRFLPKDFKNMIKIFPRLLCR